MFDYDAELRAHNALFRAAAGVQPTDQVLDIGCGAGLTTREAARAAHSGAALGVDISAAMVERARRITAVEGPDNATFRQLDAEAQPLPAGEFDRCISRFGTMFFTDRTAAFANIARALRPGAALTLLVWQDQDANEWSTAIRRAITTATPPDTPDTPDMPAATPPDTPAAFSLADPATTETALTTAGFADVEFTDVHEPVYYGADVAAAYDSVLSLQEPERLLAALDERAAERARANLRAVLAEHVTESGVFFDSRAWLITARR